jgi:hypothetical protein
VTRQFFESLGPARFRECQLLSDFGFDQRFRAATFTLEPGHWINIDREGAIIGYAGDEKRVESPVLMVPEVAFLPIEHTELTVGAQPGVRRHFIEVFSWVPALKPATWTLTWHVVEVVRSELVDITTQELTTIAGDRAPGDPPDVRAFARLGVNEDGVAEWSVLTGPNQGTELIEPDSERRERMALDQRRDAALKQVNWERVGDVSRLPTMGYSDSEGCGNIFIYGWSTDRMEAVSFSADKDQLGLTTTARTFNLATDPIGIELKLHVFERPFRGRPFCTDVIQASFVDEIWSATAGTVTIELSSQNAPAGRYRAIVRIVGAEFVNAAGTRVSQTGPIILTGIVGWFAG